MVDKEIQDLMEQMIDDTAFAATWDADKRAPTKNAIYDAFKFDGTEAVDHIKVGTYTGDGSADWSKAITCGWRAKFVFIYPDKASDSSSEAGFLYIDAGNKRSFVVYISVIGCYDNRVRSSATGFEVSDDGGDYPPNANGVGYSYIAMG